MKKTLDGVAEIEVSYRPAIGNKPIVKSALDVYTEFIPFFSPDTIALQEKFMVMYLNRASRILGVYPMSSGGMTGTVADLRLIMSVALKIAATSIIICHNHPSGNLNPSSADLAITVKIKEAASLFDIKLMDHLIISPDGKFFSFADDGLL